MVKKPASKGEGFGEVTSEAQLYAKLHLTRRALMTLRDSGLVIAVVSNIAHANTCALGLKIGDAFAKEAR